MNQVSVEACIRRFFDRAVTVQLEKLIRDAPGLAIELLQWTSRICFRISHVCRGRRGDLFRARCALRVWLGTTVPNYGCIGD